MTTQNQIENTNIAGAGANSNITSMTGLTGYLQAPLGVKDSSGNKVVIYGSNASAVNYIQLTNNATGLPPVINAFGTDTNIDLNIGGQGTGAVNILGAGTNSSAPTGYVGEFISSQILFASAVSFSNGIARNITSISLTAGDWDVWGNIFVNYSVSSNGTAGAISTTSATMPDNSLLAGPYSFVAGAIADVGYPVLPVRISISMTTTVYLVAFSNFTGGASTGSGGIYARRIR